MHFLSFRVFILQEEIISEGLWASSGDVRHAFPSVFVNRRIA